MTSGGLCFGRIPEGMTQHFRLLFGGFSRSELMREKPQVSRAFLNAKATLPLGGGTT